MKSMTGFGRAERSDVKLDVSIEIKTVNNRNIDLHINYPTELRPLDPVMRNIVRQKVRRGRVDCYISYKTHGEDLSVLSVNRNILKQFFDELEELKVDFNFKSDVTLDHILRIPDVVRLDISSGDLPEWLVNSIEETLKEALDSLDKMRAREGAETAKLLSKYILNIENNLKEIKEKQDVVQKQLYEKYKANIEGYLAEAGVDDAKVAQEAAIASEKADISEEVDRLDSHIKGFKLAVKEKGSIGKKLDFILQEMSRETNTMNAKTAGINVNRLGIEIKLDVEKLREQVQNIE